MSAFAIASMFPDNQIDKALAPAQCVWLYCTCYTCSQDDEGPTPRKGPGSGPRPGSGPFPPSYPRPGGHPECQNMLPLGTAPKEDCATQRKTVLPSKFKSGHLSQSMSFNAAKMRVQAARKQKKLGQVCMCVVKTIITQLLG